MKRYGYLYLIFLLFLTGCSREYRAEKLYWKAENISRDIVNKREKEVSELGREEKEIIIKAFQNVVETYPGTNTAGKAQFLIGQFYLKEGNFDEAQESFLKVVRNYAQLPQLNSEARFMVGWIYENKGDWAKAEEVYRQIPITHPFSRKGLQVPIYIAQHYRRNKDMEIAQKLYKNAIRDYEKLINSATNKEMVAYIKGFIAASYMQMGDWDGAIDTLSNIIQEYPQLPQAPLSLFTLGKIYEERLNQPQKAKEIYEKLVNNYPRHVLAKIILNKYKEF